MSVIKDIDKQNHEKRGCETPMDVKKHREEPLHLQYLHTFYRKYFPVALFSRFFGLSAHREVSFMKQNERVIRYLSFDGADALMDALLKEVPLKFDLGSNYVSVPAMNSNNIFKSRELVFDIDMTDYMKEMERKGKTGGNKTKHAEGERGVSSTALRDTSDVHVCDKLCDDCIAQMNRIIALLKEILTDHFGFTHVIFFFSGNKGFHCYVMDALTSHFASIVRHSIASYLKKHSVLVDENVTKDVKHLLKAPFCVHPKSGYVCVPVVEGIEKVHVSDVVCGNVGLEKYYKFFEEFVNNLHSTVCG
ncbi:hypothetical protein VCUG_01990 [Vavraia culicis subsp. floridensis]|uniref:DNA primase n=1 Tax=Vavraia culicis (isolate floridensis) TaxID=948595 RepID=L2GT84_VAVCU|nr:uncharacterized protein VCUG_01990 [Vavraia culicis subsp. floridensis]ELA46498.1 hypothetical protein VCUG_01990 [Vavraia culicis subsp. floridensis]